MKKSQKVRKKINVTFFLRSLKGHVIVIHLSVTGFHKY